MSCLKVFNLYNRKLKCDFWKTQESLADFIAFTNEDPNNQRK